jgi:signal transduction histidine kinase
MLRVTMAAPSGTEVERSPVESAAASVAAAMWAAADSLQARLELVLDERLGALTPDQRGFLQVARADGQRLLKLIGDFREIACADAGLLELDWGRVDIAAAAAEAAEAVAARADVLGKRVAVTAEQPVVVSADPQRFRNALRRILRHAVQHSAPGSTIELDVLATGIRIRHEAESAPAPDALDLAFATAIARAHGGGVTVSFDGGVVTVEASVGSSDMPVVQLVA